MNHLKQLIVVAAALLSCAAAGATCYGSGSYRTCSDASGNSYTVKRYGELTQAQGTNAQTGSAWSQSSRAVGNATRHQGSAADGSAWSGTSQPMGGATFHRGVDSDGRSYTRICPASGCS